MYFLVITVSHESSEFLFRQAGFSIAFTHILTIDAISLNCRSDSFCLAEYRFTVGIEDAMEIEISVDIL
jgi:hypothetical protein